MATHRDREIYADRITNGLPSTVLGNLFVPGGGVSGPTEILDCADASLVGYADDIPAPFFWVCDGGTYVAAHSGESVAGETALPWAYLEAPTRAAFPASDDFSGDGTNSGSVGDDNWDERWPTLVSEDTGGSAAINSTALDMQANLGGAVSQYKILSPLLAHPGDFTLTVDFSNFSGDTAGTTRTSWAGIGATIDGTEYSIFRNSTTAEQFESNTVASSPTTATSGKLRIRRISGTANFDFDDGSGWVNLRSASYSGNLEQVSIWMIAVTTIVNVTCTFDNFTLVDGSGDPINIIDAVVEPVDCADLKSRFWPATDRFSGEGYDSGAVDDANWARRWNPASFGNASATIVSEAVRLAITTGAASNGYYLTNRAKEQTAWKASNWKVSNSFSNLSLSRAGGRIRAEMYTDTGAGSNYWIISRVNDTGGQRLQVASLSGGIVVNEANTDTSGTFEVEKSGNSLLMKYNGVTKHTYDVTGVTFDSVGVPSIYSDNTGNSGQYDVDNYTLIDGAGDPIPVYWPAGFEASDAFSGTGQDSGAVGDVNWNQRYASQTGVSISGSKLAYSLTGPALESYARTIIGSTGDFHITLNYDNLVLPASNRWDFGIVAYHTGGSGAIHVGRAYDDVDSTGQSWHTFNGSTDGWGADASTSGSIELIRSSGTVTMKVNGTTRATFAFATAIDYFVLLLWRSAPSTGTGTVNISSTTMLDGSGDPILITAAGGCTPAALIMDTNPAAYAYSTMLVRTAYTGPLIRVREAGGDTEADIYALSSPDAAGNYTVDTAAIAAHCGANVGYVTKIYDQMGTGVDLVQTNTFRQRQIYSGSAVYTSGTNNVPALENYNVGLSFGHYTWQGSGNLSTPLTIYVVHHADVSDNDYHFYGAGASTLRAFLTTTPDIRLIGPSTLTGSHNWVNLGITEYIANGASSSIRWNEDTPTTGDIGSTLWDDTTYIWAKDNGADYVIGTTLELFIYESAIDSTDSATIRADRNSRIGIY